MASIISPTPYIPSRTWNSFGVDVTGSTDSTTAVQTALTWAYTARGKIEGNPNDQIQINSGVTVTFPCIINMNGGHIFTGSSFTSGTAVSVVVGSALWGVHRPSMDMTVWGPYASDSVRNIPNLSNSTLSGYTPVDGVSFTGASQTISNIDITLKVDGFRDNVIFTGANWYIFRMWSLVSTRAWRRGLSFTSASNSGENMSFFGGLIANCQNPLGTAIGIYEDGSSGYAGYNFMGVSLDYNDIQLQCGAGNWDFDDSCHMENNNTNPMINITTTSGQPKTRLRICRMVAGNGGSGYISASPPTGRPYFIYITGSPIIEYDGKYTSFGNSNSALYYNNGGTPVCIDIRGWTDNENNINGIAGYASNINNSYSNLLGNPSFETSFNNLWNNGWTLDGSNNQIRNGSGQGATVTSGSIILWSVSTAYTVGQKVQNTSNGFIYIVTVAGTSASTGTGPSATTGNISDGSVTWNYVGNSIPTNWYTNASSLGVAVTTTAIGTGNNAPIQFTISGTPTSSGALDIYPEALNHIATQQNQTWVASCGVEMVGMPQGISSASGVIIIGSSGLTATNYVTIGNTQVTCVASGATGNQINVVGTQSTDTATLLAFLQASTDYYLSQCSYAAGGNASCTSGTISSNTLTVAGTVTGIFSIGQAITGTNVTAGTIITGYGTGSGGTGTYILSASSTVSSGETITATGSGVINVYYKYNINGTNGSTVAFSAAGPGRIIINGGASCTSGTISGTVLTVAGTVLGNFAVGQTITGTGVTANTTITSLGTGTGGTGTYNLSQSSTVSSGESIYAYNTSTFTTMATNSTNGVAGIYTSTTPLALIIGGYTSSSGYEEGNNLTVTQLTNSYQLLGGPIASNSLITTFNSSYTMTNSLTTRVGLGLQFSTLYIGVPVNIVFWMYPPQLSLIGDPLNQQYSKINPLSNVYPVRHWFDNTQYFIGNYSSGSCTLGTITNGSGSGGYILTVAGTVTGTFSVGQTISGTGVAYGTTITSLGTGTGGAGTYNLSNSSTILTGQTINAGYVSLAVTSNTFNSTWPVANSNTGTIVLPYYGLGSSGSVKPGQQVAISGMLLPGQNTSTTTSSGAYGTAGIQASFFDALGNLISGPTTIGTSVAQASGYISFGSGISAGATITLNGTVYTAISGTSTGTNFKVVGTASTDALSFLTQAIANGPSTASYELSSNTSNVLITYNGNSTAGNSFTLAVSGSGLTVSGATLSGASGQTPQVAVGSISFNNPMVSGDIITVNGVAFTATSGSTSGTNFNIGTSASTAAANFLTALSNNSSNSLINVATYTARSGLTNIIDIKYNTYGTVGNSFTLSFTPIGTINNVAVSGSTLLGGTSWVQVSGYLTAPNGASTVRIYPYISNFYGQINYDNFQVWASS